MTTLSEYKAMMEGATDAPWVFIHENYAIYGAPDIRGAQGRVCEIDITDDHISNAQFIATSRNIAPSLIRVIELAEEKFEYILNNSYSALAVGQAMEALSEIIKLKGE